MTGASLHQMRVRYV